MDIFATYATDPKAEMEGREHQIGDGAYITVARSGNKMYNRMLAKSFEAAKHTLSQKNDESEALADQIIVDTLSKSVLLGWRGLEFKGESITYSVENAKKLLAVKDFRATVTRLAEDFNNFKLQDEAEDEGNSEPTSSGSKTGGQE
jgi:hypothetical protein